MDINIKNVGIVKEASVKLNGLTVIAGENDSGKSTVGKLIFATVKAVSRYEQDLKESKEQNILKMMEDIYVFLRNSIVEEDLKTFSDVGQLFRPSFFYEHIKPYFDESSMLVTNSLEVNKFLDEKEKIVMLFSEAMQTRILPKLDSLRKYIFYQESKENKILRALRRSLYAEFYSDVSPKGNSKISKVKLNEGNTAAFQFSMKKNEIIDLKVGVALFFEDVTFIESPIVMQMYDMISSASTLMELFNGDKSERLYNASKAKVALHLKDLVSKLASAQYYIQENTGHKDHLENIANTISGGFSFEEQEKDFAFSKKSNKKEKFKIKSVNTASGIKSFGIIQLLIQAGFVDTRSLLIIDEPETHLHPKWQVEYARLLVELVKNDVSILITSHSPYMIQALKVFSDKADISDRTAFYLSERTESNEFTEINEVTKNLNKLFTKLSDPLRELV